MRVLVTGSSGLIGTALVERLRARGDEVTRLVRTPGPVGLGEARWDPAGGEIDGAAVEGHDAVVHLAGAGIGDRRWTDDQKRSVMESRVKGTTLLAEAIARAAPPPPVLVSASAIGYYGDRGDETLTEDSESGDGFLAEVCRRWERAAEPATQGGTRVVNVRTGLVLSTRGGALGKLLLPFRLGAGGRVGSGAQWWSWISIDDEVGGIVHAIDTVSVSGPLNLTAPEPIRQRDFATALGQALHRPAVLPTPTFALKAVLGGQLVDEMLLAGQRVLPAKLEATGYAFTHPGLGPALRSVLDRDA